MCLQSSTWLIDPYWTLAPPLVAAFWVSHAASAPVNARQLCSTALLLIWAARLTHSYFRREKWAVGEQEDWRYADMKIQFGKWWPVVQVGLPTTTVAQEEFVQVYFAQCVTFSCT